MKKPELQIKEFIRSLDLFGTFCIKTKSTSDLNTLIVDGKEVDTK